MAQVLMTIGTFIEGKFTVTDMLFSKGKKSKNDMLVDWLRKNGKEGEMPLLQKALPGEHCRTLKQVETKLELSTFLLQPI